MSVDAFHYEGPQISYSDSQSTFDLVYMGHRKKRARSCKLQKRHFFIEAETPLLYTITYELLLSI